MQSFGRSLLVLGGARSGKSRHAQAAAEALGGRAAFVATAQAFDTEMTDRIVRHQADRDARWRTIEVRLDLAEALRAINDAVDDVAVILVDCLTLWASNLLLSEADPTGDGAARIAERVDALIAAIPMIRVPVIFVSNEVGLGIVPDNALARQFRDLAGTINQRVAAEVQTVEFVAAGLPLRLKNQF